MAGTICCLALSASLGLHKVTYPGSATYTASLESYFSVQQESLNPACIVSAQSVQDVSTAVQVLDLLQKEGEECLFAVRSGGHMSWAGASNIQGGLVFDLRALDTITLSADQASVSTGVGATWDQLYETLDPHGLGVNGGRAAGVGVGGLTLGGGISYTSPRYGWTCDTVLAYQIVLANGTIVEADATSHADLLWALRGGNNNFGIVTNIVLATFQQSLVWSGTLYHQVSEADAVINELVTVNSPTSYDEYASIITAFSYSQAAGPLIANLLAYTQEVEATPDTFSGFFALPSIYNATAVTNLTELSKETAATNPSGHRSINLVSTLVSSTEVLSAAYAAWAASYIAVENVTDIIFGLTYEPLPPIFYQRHAADNALGLSNRTDSLVITLITVSWTNAADDDLVYTTSQSLLDNIRASTSKLGGLDGYIYANYAGKNENVIASYGTASVERLKQVRQQVDPRGMFTYQVPGGYKIPGN